MIYLVGNKRQIWIIFYRNLIRETKKDGVGLFQSDGRSLGLGITRTLSRARKI